jgi:hypothetical protein
MCGKHSFFLLIENDTLPWRCLPPPSLLMDLPCWYPPPYMYVKHTANAFFGGAIPAYYLCDLDALANVSRWWHGMDVSWHVVLHALRLGLKDHWPFYAGLVIVELTIHYPGMIFSKASSSSPPKTKPKRSFCHSRARTNLPMIQWALLHHPQMTTLPPFRQDAFLPFKNQIRHFWLPQRDVQWEEIIAHVEYWNRSDGDGDIATASC